jgi:hypothetical protein
VGNYPLIFGRHWVCGLECPRARRVILGLMPHCRLGSTVILQNCTRHGRCALRGSTQASMQTRKHIADKWQPHLLPSPQRFLAASTAQVFGKARFLSGSSTWSAILHGAKFGFVYQGKGARTSRRLKKAFCPGGGSHAT